MDVILLLYPLSYAPTLKRCIIAAARDGCKRAIPPKNGAAAGL